MTDNGKSGELALDITKQFWKILGIGMNNTWSSTTTPAPSSDNETAGGGNNGSGDETTTHVSAGLVGALIFVIVIVVIIVVRKKMNRHRKSSDGRDSDAEMDSLSDIAVYQDSSSRNVNDDVIITRDGRTLSRRKLIESMWVEDEELRSVMKRYTVKSNRIQLGRLFGKGQYGCVYEAKLSKDNRRSNDYGKLSHDKVAVKTLRGSDIYPELVEEFLKEALLMKDFRHKHVLGFLGVSFGKENVPMIVLPFMANGNLRHYVADPNKQLTLRELISFAHQVALGMDYLADQKFVHRDLAARNCMLDEELVVKVADFGLSRDIYTKEYYSSDDQKARLPVKWMAIESLTKNVYTSKSDVWSFGVLLWELMTRGVTPYPDISNWDVRHYVTSGRRLDNPELCPHELYLIMLNCWAAEPRSRPTFSDLSRQLKEILDWEENEETDALYVNVPCTPPTSPI